jgi:hypothetical protein
MALGSLSQSLPYKGRDFIVKMDVGKISLKLRVLKERKSVRKCLPISGGIPVNWGKSSILNYQSS